MALFLTSCFVFVLSILPQVFILSCEVVNIAYPRNPAFVLVVVVVVVVVVNLAAAVAPAAVVDLKINLQSKLFFSLI